VLVFFDSKQIFIHNFGLVNFAFLPHFFCDFNVGLFITRLLAIYHASKNPLTKQISSLCAIPFLQNSQIDASLADSPLDFLSEFKVLDVCLVNLLDDEVLADQIYWVVASHIVKELLIADWNQLPTLPKGSSQNHLSMVFEKIIHF
jgi:hypothetical protein